jgi:hypothetical protein
MNTAMATTTTTLSSLELPLFADMEKGNDQFQFKLEAASLVPNPHNAQGKCLGIAIPLLSLLAHPLNRVPGGYLSIASFLGWQSWRQRILGKRGPREPSSKRPNQAFNEKGGRSHYPCAIFPQLLHVFCDDETGVPHQIQV